MTCERSWKLRATAFAMVGNLACIWFPMTFDLIEVNFGGSRLFYSRFGPMLGLVAPVGWLMWAFWSIGRSRSKQSREALVWGVSLVLFGLWSLLWFPHAAGSQDEFTRLHREVTQVIRSNEPMLASQFYDLIARAWFCYGVPSGLGLSVYGLLKQRLEGISETKHSAAISSSSRP